MTDGRPQPQTKHSCSPVPERPGEGPLTEPRAGAQPWRRNWSPRRRPSSPPGDGATPRSVSYLLSKKGRRGYTRSRPIPTHTGRRAASNIEHRGFGMAIDVALWLRGLGLEQYASGFADNDVDAAVLPELTAEDLIALGVTSIGHRRRLLSAIATLRGQPPEVAALAPAAVASIEAERRQLTVMFCDLLGSSALSARLDPEDLRAVIGAYHACIAEVIARNEGVIARYMGDGVLAYFGFPQAHEDDAEQATRAGLALVDAVSNLKTDIGTAVQVRIGIATGMVVVGDLTGEGAAKEQAVIGETPNLAARLQQFAEPGTVLICESTHRLTDGHFEYRNLGPVALRGWTEAIPAWQVLATSGVESRFEAQHK